MKRKEGIKGSFNIITAKTHTTYPVYLEKVPLDVKCLFKQVHVGDTMNIKVYRTRSGKFEKQNDDPGIWSAEVVQKFTWGCMVRYFGTGLYESFVWHDIKDILDNKMIITG